MAIRIVLGFLFVFGLATAMVFSTRGGRDPDGDLVHSASD